MTIKVGDKMPEGGFAVMTGEGPGGLTTAELFGGKKVVLFSVPGAFTPTCSAKHLPGFVEQAAALKAKGWQRRLREGTRSGNRRIRIRHGHTQLALCAPRR